MACLLGLSCMATYPAAKLSASHPPTPSFNCCPSKISCMDAPHAWDSVCTYIIQYRTVTMWIMGLTVRMLAWVLHKQDIVWRKFVMHTDVCHNVCVLLVLCVSYRVHGSTCTCTCMYGACVCVHQFIYSFFRVWWSLHGEMVAIVIIILWKLTN